MPVEALFIKPSSGLDCGIGICSQTSTNVWSCFDALSNKYHQSVFQQVLLLTIDIFLWSSLLHLLLFTNQSPYRRRCCVCVFAEHLRWHRLVSLGFEHVPPSLQCPPFSSQYFTHSCFVFVTQFADIMHISRPFVLLVKAVLYVAVVQSGLMTFPWFSPFSLSFTLPQCKKCFVR